METKRAKERRTVNYIYVTAVTFSFIFPKLIMAKLNEARKLINGYLCHMRIFSCIVATTMPGCWDVSLVAMRLKTFSNDLQHLKMLVSFGSVSACVCVSACLST